MWQGVENPMERAIKSLLKEDNPPKSKLTRDRLELKRSRFNPSRPFFSRAAYHDIEDQGKDRKRKRRRGSAVTQHR